MSDNENSKKYVFNRVVIILVFICFAMAAFYFSFQSSEMKGSFLSADTGSLIPDKIDRYIFKKYYEHQDSAKNDVIANAVQEKGHCYEARYVDNITLLNRLNVSFVEGVKTFSALNALMLTSSSDQKVINIVESLHKLFEYNESYSIVEAQLRLKYLRRELIKNKNSEEMDSSFFGRVLFRSVIVQKRGSKAIDAGGIEASLERASNALKAKNLKKAYHEIDSIEGVYHDMSKGWLLYIAQYIAAQEDIRRVNSYMHSDGYRKQFYKECG
jgi:hypothetical protein